MKTFSITIQDDKESIFIELMKCFTFVKKIEVVSADSEIPAWHKTILDQRLEAKNKDSISWDVVQEEINSKYGL
ncbi:MAG: hypothetical protein Q7U54_14730 [Bacteroidales bacterium]|nr:hypothetical protein [Bacteroidales bacterium]